jgi:hypothetical protein
MIKNLENLIINHNLDKIESILLLEISIKY